MADHPTLSVIIPSYRSRHLDEVVKCAGSLSPVEIIVVDSSPEPITPADENVKLIALSECAYAGDARNIGARRAVGEILLFLDSDVVPTAQGLEAVRRHITDLGDAVVCGVYDDRRRDEGFVARLQNVILKQRHLADPGAVPWGSSSHFLMRRAVFERVGGFNPFIASYEDVEFFARCSKAGFQVRADSSFEAAHLKTLDLAGLFGDYLRKAFQAIQIRRTYRHVFAGVASRLGPAMLASWFASALLPPFILLSLVVPVPPV